MPRTTKCRRVCAEPEFRRFMPDGAENGCISMTTEELESLRLCDFEGLEQEDSAGIMNVSRGTFQRILYAARKKVATALCTGMGISIEGGNYELANCSCNCHKRCSECHFNKDDK